MMTFKHALLFPVQLFRLKKLEINIFIKIKFTHTIRTSCRLNILIFLVFFALEWITKIPFDDVYHDVDDYNLLWYNSISWRVWKCVCFTYVCTYVKWGHKLNIWKFSNVLIVSKWVLMNFDLRLDLKWQRIQNNRSGLLLIVCIWIL